MTIIYIDPENLTETIVPDLPNPALSPCEEFALAQAKTNETPITSTTPSTDGEV